MDQPFDEAVKWSVVMETSDDLAMLRHVHSPLGSVPQFITPAQLPPARYLQPYSQDIVVSGGDYTAGAGPRIVEIASLLAPGLVSAPVPGDPHRWRISGTPAAGGSNYLYLRVNDSDGDPAWRIFSLQVTGGPGVLVESDFRGTFSGAGDLPWTKAHSVDSRVDFSGWNIGAPYHAGGGTALNGADGRGVRLYSDTDGLHFSVSQGTADSTYSTLASAIADREDWTFTITPQPGEKLDLRQAEFRLEWTRLTYHAPRHVAVFSSAGGFAESQKIFETSGTPAEGTNGEIVFDLPDTAAYANITTPVEFRVVFFRSQYAHHAKILGFKLTAPRMADGEPPSPPPAAVTYTQWIGQHADSLPPGERGAFHDPDGDGVSNFLEYALDRDPARSDPAPPLTQRRAGTVLELGFRAARSGLVYEVETSTTLEPDSWTVVDIGDFEIGGDVLVTIPLNPGIPRRFFRLRVTGAEPLVAQIERIVDNADSDQVTITGSWAESDAVGGRYGPKFLHDRNTGKGNKSVRFAPELPEAGTYEVFVRWPNNDNSLPRATNVPVIIDWAGGANQVIVNQRKDVAQWVSVGTYNFLAGHHGSVTISNEDTDGYVLADAVRFVRKAKLWTPEDFGDRLWMYWRADSLPDGPVRSWVDLRRRIELSQNRTRRAKTSRRTFRCGPRSVRARCSSRPGRSV
jgi:hypothetical protein